MLKLTQKQTAKEFVHSDSTLKRKRADKKLDSPTRSYGPKSCKMNLMHSNVRISTPQSSR